VGKKFVGLVGPGYLRPVSVWDFACKTEDLSSRVREEKVDGGGRGERKRNQKAYHCD